MFYDIAVVIYRLMLKNHIKSDEYIRPSFWRRLLAFWTFLSLTAVVGDFVIDDGFTSSLIPILIIYVAVLSAYSSEKEFRRWHDYHSGRHPGELYVLLWTIVLVGIFVAEIVLEKPYEMPDAVISTYIVTLGILAITRTSRALRSEKTVGKESPRD